MDTVLILIALASAFCFALALVLTQFGLRITAPLTGAAIAVPTTALLFLVISPLTVAWNQWACSSATTFAVVGLFFPVAVTLLTFSANRRIGPDLTGTLGNLTPLFAVVLAIVLMGEAPSATQELGIVAICAGVALLFVGRGNGDARPALWTLGLPLSAAFLRGIAQPMVKWGLADWPSPFAAVTIGYMVSAVVMGGVILGRRDGGDWPARAGIWWFIAVGVVNGAAVLLLYMALSRGPVTIVAPLVACYPLLTLILNRLFLGQSIPTRFALAGIFITVTGVGLLLRS
jgi:drug/metabolite transporter (DMT)-like permease